MGQNLAIIGSVKEELLNTEELALILIRRLLERYPGVLSSRYGLEGEERDLQVLEDIAVSRKCVVRGNELSYEKAAGILLDDFRSGRLGRITLEYPQEEIKG